MRAPEHRGSAVLQVRRVAWPFRPARGRIQNRDRILTSNSTKARDQAEVAFGKTQTQSLARERSYSEIDAVAAARDAKTARLRQLRLEKEAADLLTAPPAKKPGKRRSGV